MRLAIIFPLLFAACCASPDEASCKKDSPQLADNFRRELDLRGGSPLGFRDSWHPVDTAVVILAVADRVTIGVGRTDGVRAGDRFFVQRFAGFSFSYGWLARIEAEVVQERSSECRIIERLYACSPIQRGDEAVAERETPVDAGTGSQPAKPEDQLEHPNLPASPGVDWSRWGVDEAFTSVGQLVEFAFSRGKFYFLVSLETADAPPAGARLAAPEMTGNNNLSVTVVRHYHVDDDETKQVEELGCSIEAVDVTYQPAKKMRFLIPN
ncbi:MAG: hypothetical protein H6841_07080 [Planctomycetes bacterium]|nr:hypothetical protein [Planctomycetota bacterium]MCB9935264.1 hypothetical protein [Planctomycetota bacterium]